MPIRRLIACAVLLGVALPAGLAAAELAVAPVQDQVGHPRAVAAVEGALGEVLASEHRLVEPRALRDALRAGRLRDVDAATPQELARLGETTGANLLLSTTLHHAVEPVPPRLTLSARLHRLADGELLWSGFESASGLDHRGILGLGVIDRLDVLAGRTTARLLERMHEAVANGTAPPAAAPGAPPGDDLGPVALVPLSSVAERGATRAAAAVTEAVRAELGRRGIETVSPGAVSSALRRQKRFVWGGVDDDVRTALLEQAGARHVLTGAVEAYDVGGSAAEPEPYVAVALRLVDSETGRIVWMGGRERSGWDGADLFRVGRIYTRGELARRMTETLITRLLEERGSQRRNETFRIESSRP